MTSTPSSPLARAFHSFAPQDAACVYGITNGVARYLEEFDDGMSLEENVARRICDPSAYLYEEPQNLLQQELRDPAQYNNVLQSIADGSSRVNEIATASHLETSRTSAALKSLMELGIVKREAPFGVDSERKSIYRIDDSFYHFWYRFVPENRMLMEAGRADLAAGRIMARISEFMGPVFEDMCRQWLLEHNGNDLPLLILKMGRWWGGDPRTKSQEELDIVASGDPKGCALIAECKWTSKAVDAGVLERLAYRAELLPYPHAYLYLFSKSGFTDECLHVAANSDGVRLVSFNEMWA